MKNPRIYIDTQINLDQILNLAKAPSHYLGSVLRMKEHDQVRVFNGDGGYYQCAVQFANKKNVSLNILQFFDESRESNLQTHIGLGMSLGDRMEYAIQKASELGVSQITPLITSRSELKLKGEKLQKKLNRWQQVAISSCEQNGRNVVPTINTPMLIEQFVELEQDSCKLVLHHRDATNIKDIEQNQNVCALIGPEGGLTQDEINLAIKHGFTATTLGPRILRTETAPVVLLSVLQTLWGDF
ncbi:MAG: 16S rRNA (uracil(1498)-N(3))-methyltransferase [Saccharospirillaceae bacterium]|nr:16S rRNA (uracil(1498)-N(3))-methyltransferase [Pseudomonadales bacterium]NRB77933.1 16S rRNA (uracil(1498)-N(3))-methyltransferase [Saccharospirillaceae bacterium]